jgi:DNA-binding MarR family transcriptional regulator
MAKRSQAPAQRDASSVEALANRWNSVAIHLTRRLRLADAQWGVPPARLSALSVLVFGGSCTLGELARREQVTPPTMTHIVTGLETMGLARRVASEDDARLVIVEPTTAGRRLMARGRAARVERLAAALQALPAEDLDVLERAATVLAQVERGMEGSGP